MPEGSEEFKARNPMGQRVRIYKRDVKNCPGCEAVVDKRKAENHSEECRARFVKIFSETEEGRKRLEQADERVARVAKRRKPETEEKGEEKPQKAEDPRKEPMSKEAKDFMVRWAVPEEEKQESSSSSSSSSDSSDEEMENVEVPEPIQEPRSKRRDEEKDPAERPQKKGRLSAMWVPLDLECPS